MERESADMEASPEDARSDDPSHLPRRLGLWSATAVLVGATIGSGIFRVPSTVAADVGSVGSIAVLWILGSMLVLLGALTMAELATMFPEPGGTYAYLREAYGEPVAFTFGWTRLLLIQPSVLGGIALIFAAYAQAFLPIGDTGVRLLAAATLLVLAAANYRSVVWGAVIQNTSTAAKVLALVGLALAVFVFGDGTRGAFAEEIALSPTTWGGFGIALIAVLWSYDGWGELLYVAGEVKDPGRVLPAAMLMGVLTVTVVYLLANAAFLYVLPLGEMASSELVAADATTRVFGSIGASLIAALVMVSTFGALNGALMGGPRVFFAMAEDGLFFRQVGKVHPEFETPHVAIATAALLGVLYLSLRTFEQLVSAFILGIWPFYVLAAWGVLRLRRMRPEAPRPYRVFGYPVTPLLFMGASSAMLLNALLRQPLPTLFSFGIILTGVPAYFVWKKVAGGERIVTCATAVVERADGSLAQGTRRPMVGTPPRSTDHGSVSSSQAACASRLRPVSFGVREGGHR